MSRERESRLDIATTDRRFAVVRRSLGAWLIAGLGLAPSSVMALSPQSLTLQGNGTSQTLSVEVSRTPQERSRGLMERDSLPESAGMLFLYEAEQPGSSAYWMYKTRIPLDIAFIDSHGVIRALKTMSPCRAKQSSQCPVYPAGAPFRAALETNAGYFDRHGIVEGDRVDLAPWLESR